MSVQDVFYVLIDILNTTGGHPPDLPRFSRAIDYINSIPPYHISYTMS